MRRTTMVMWACLLSMVSQAADAADQPVAASSNRIAVITGYHGYNAPLLVNALKPRGVQIEQISGWLPLGRYGDFGVVILDGWLERAKIEPAKFAAEDLQALRRYVEAGGTFIFMRHGWRSFDSKQGKAFLADVMGIPDAARADATVAPDHPWTRHLGGTVPDWVRAGAGDPLNYSTGTSAIDVSWRRTYLWHRNLGKGQIIYLGWDIFRFRPEGRTKTTPEQELAYNQQTEIVKCIAESLFPETATPLPTRVFFDAPYTLPDGEVRPLPPAPDSAAFRSYPPTRPLPTVSDRPRAAGPARYVDVTSGSDDADGAEKTPWKTLQHAVNQLQPGETLYLRQGTYFENVTIARGGEPGRPITLRSYPGEMAVIDGGLREFVERPETAWEPAQDGAPGEFRSTTAYPDLGTNPNAPNLLARFGDSLIPMQGYRFLADLRSDNPYWNIADNASDKQTMYCGPGVWYDPQTGRIHCRLAHTMLPGLGEENYRGETDPRRLPLIIGHRLPALSIINARHIVLQDLVVRGSRSATIAISVAGDIILDGLNVYGGSTCLSAAYVQGLRAIHCAFRGIGAPWTFRTNLKYRSLEAEIVTLSSWQPTGNSDMELAYCEFTDSVDGVFIGNVADARFHHNVLDNVTDDGIYLTALADNNGAMRGGDILIYQNRLSRSLTMFAFGVGHGRQTKTNAGTTTGRGVWIFRNVFDFRSPVYYFQPKGPDEPQELTAAGRSQGDHGSPTWEPMYIYQNTIIARQPAFRSYYGHGWGGQNNKTVRAVLNNIIVQIGQPVGTAIDPGGFALLLDGNLHWSLSHGGDVQQVKQMVNRVLGDRKPDLAGFPRRLAYPDDPGATGPIPLQDLLDLASPSGPPAYRAERDQCADPRFVQLDPDWRQTNDYRLRDDSPARGVAVPLPERWPDPLRRQDRGDLGAIPFDSPGWRVGVHGRFHVAIHP